MSTQFGDALVWLAKNNAGILAAMPGGLSPDKVDQSPPPAIPYGWFTIQGAEGPGSLSGAAARACEYTVAQMFVRAENPAQKKAVGDAWRNAIGDLGQGVVTINGMRFAALRLRGRSSSDDSEGNGNDEIYRGWDFQISGWAVLT